MPETMLDRDPIYLFLCHLEWRKHRRIAAYHELLAALDDHDPDIRQLAEDLIRRGSLYPRTREEHLKISAATMQHSGNE